ncbi:MAG: hypothetical protein J0L84_01470 [Verrucomicrobia bacterium]|nr:hypothetical protein [Verrucomicrobiota bacterium]
MSLLSPGERRVLTLVLFLVITGLAAQWWLRSRPPAPLPAAEAPSR